MHSYLCKCDIHPGGHLVRKIEKLAHILEIKQFKANQVLFQFSNPHLWTWLIGLIQDLDLADNVSGLAVVDDEVSFCTLI
jgi:hypothetical protein